MEDIIYKIIANRVSIRDDYNGKGVVGFLNEGEIIYPIKIINNWAMIINDDKYRWIKLYSDENVYAIKVDEHEITDTQNITFHDKDYSSYLNFIE